MARKIKPANAVNKGSRLAAIIIMMIGLFGMIGLAYLVTQSQNETVDIIRLSRTLNSGDIISEGDIQSFTILKDSYSTLGTVANDEGTQYVQSMILWSDREQVIGKYMTTNTRAGSYLSMEDITDTLILRNPWVEEMSADEEIYTLAFNASDVNTRLLYPGSSLRVRLTFTVPADDADELREEINKADISENITVNDVRQSVVLQRGTNYSQGSDESSEVAVSEVIIDRLIITDMLNSSGESIYDLYMALLRLPVSQRKEYLSTSLNDSDIAMAFQSRVSPAYLVLVVDKQAANFLAEFEATSKASIKYTILPDLEEDSLMTSFIEISNQINSYISIGGE